MAQVFIAQQRLPAVSLAASPSSHHSRVFARPSIPPCCARSKECTRSNPSNRPGTPFMKATSAATPVTTTPSAPSSPPLTSPFLGKSSLAGLRPPRQRHPQQASGQPPRNISRPRLRPPSCFLEPVFVIVGLAIAATAAALTVLPVLIFAVSAVAAGVGLLAAASSFAIPLLGLFLLGNGFIKIPAFSAVMFLDKSLCLLLCGYFLVSLVSYIGDVAKLRAARNKNYSDPSLRDMVGLDPLPWTERFKLMAEQAGWKQWQEGYKSGESHPDWVYEAQNLRLELPSDRRFDWFLPSVLSAVPLLNGLAWVVTLRQHSSDLVPPLQTSMLRNAIIYSSPALLFLLAAFFPFSAPSSAIVCSPSLIPFVQSCKTVTITAAAAGLGAGLGAVGPFSGASWWVSVLLGAANLQMERDRAAEMLRCREAIEAADAQKRLASDPTARAAAAVSEEERQLKRFDATLRRREMERLGPPRSWSTEQVLEWLDMMGFQDYATSFEENRVTGPILLSLSAEELKQELGVMALGDRKRLIEAITALKESQY